MHLDCQRGGVLLTFIRSESKGLLEGGFIFISQLYEGLI